jgi:hypothetical protein
MPLDGNRLGPRERYVYATDDLTIAYIIETDQDLAVAGTGAGAAAPDVYDPANPPAGVTLCPAPRRFQPRCVFIQDPTSGARKSLICFSPTANLYSSSQPQSVTIDALAFTSTGRKGEKLTF